MGRKAVRTAGLTCAWDGLFMQGFLPPLWSFASVSARLSGALCTPTLCLCGLSSLPLSLLPAAPFRDSSSPLCVDEIFLAVGLLSLPSPGPPVVGLLQL